LLGPFSPIKIPSVPPGATSAWAQYSLLATDESQRTEIQHNLKEAGIPTAIYYPQPLHLQSAFSSLSYQKGDFPISEDCARRIFSLPMHPYLTEEDQNKIAHVIINGL
jgi:dTDP-4-amino-4,6-dideoxygalactose transaminase